MVLVPGRIASSVVPCCRAADRRRPPRPRPVTPSPRASAPATPGHCRAAARPRLADPQRSSAAATQVRRRSTPQNSPPTRRCRASAGSAPLGLPQLDDQHQILVALLLELAHDGRLPAGRRPPMNPAPAIALRASRAGRRSRLPTAPAGVRRCSSPGRTTAATAASAASAGPSAGNTSSVCGCSNVVVARTRPKGNRVDTRSGPNTIPAAPHDPAAIGLPCGRPAGTHGNSVRRGNWLFGDAVRLRGESGLRPSRPNWQAPAADWSLRTRPSTDRRPTLLRGARRRTCEPPQRRPAPTANSTAGAGHHAKQHQAADWICRTKAPASTNPSSAKKNKPFDRDWRTLNWPWSPHDLATNP